MTLELELLDAINSADDAKYDNMRTYLKRWGWTESCNYPGSYWLWSRDMTDADEKYWAAIAKNGYGREKHTAWGKLAGVSAEMAVKITANCLQEYPEGDDE